MFPKRLELEIMLERYLLGLLIIHAEFGTFTSFSNAEPLSLLGS